MRQLIIFFDNALGVSPEVFSGDLNVKLGEAYHDQGFSISGYMMPLLRGMFGLEVDAIKNKLYFSPKFPADWGNVKIENIQVGKNLVSMEVSKSETEYNLKVFVEGKDKVEIEFMPSLGLGNRINSAVFNGAKLIFEEIDSMQVYQIKTSFYIEENSEVILKYDPVPEVYLLPSKVTPGQANTELKVISQELNGRELKINVQGLPGKTYSLGVLNKDLIENIENAELNDSRIIINFENDGKDFVDKFVSITF